MNSAPAFRDGNEIARIYPSARMRGRLMTRIEERLLDWAILDAATGNELGRDQLGWFVGNYGGIDRATRQLSRLDENSEGGTWIVVPTSRELSAALYHSWPHKAYLTEPPTSDNSAWRSRRVWTAIPEDLKQLRSLAFQLGGGVAGLIVFDPECLMYRSRGGTNLQGHFFLNDRPQHVVSFRASLESDGWQPPLILLTSRPARAVNTELVARAFCLNGFRFIASDTFGCWNRPIDDDWLDRSTVEESQEKRPLPR